MPAITINVSAAEATRIAAVVGRVKRYTNGGGTARSATVEECRLFVIEMLKEKVLDVEQVIARETAANTFLPT